MQRLDRTRYTVADMNDHKIFGPTGYRRSYVHAVENDLLTDYKIIAFAVDEKMWIAAERICMNVDERLASQKKKQVQLTVTEAVGWLVYGIVLYGGAPEATDGKSIRTSIAFLNRTARSREMASWLRSDEGYEEVCEYFKEKRLPAPARDAAIKHLDANHRAAERRNQLDRLENAEYNAGITNVGIFGEGTDTPSLDAVAILAARKSPTDVIQIVGRCMRRSPAKTTGYVIVPVPLPRGIDAETSLGMDKLGEEWKPLGQILTALRAHDGRIEDRVQDLMDVYVPPDAPSDVEIAMVVKDGEITRTGIWKGTTTKVLEDELARIHPPAWTEKHADIRKYLNKKRGFTWSDQQLAGDRVAEKLTDRAPEADQETLAKRPQVCVLRRDRGSVKLVDTTPTAHEDPSKTGFDIGGTVRKAQNLAANRAGLRDPRRTPDDDSPANDRPTSGPETVGEARIERSDAQHRRRDHGEVGPEGQRHAGLQPAAGNHPLCCSRTGLGGRPGAAPPHAPRHAGGTTERGRQPGGERHEGRDAALAECADAPLSHRGSWRPNRPRTQDEARTRSARGRPSLCADQQLDHDSRPRLQAGLPARAPRGDRHPRQRVPDRGVAGRAAPHRVGGRERRLLPADGHGVRRAALQPGDGAPSRGTARTSRGRKPHGC